MNWDRAWIYERDCQFWHTGWQRRGEKKSKTMKNAGDAVHIWSSKVQKWNISNAGWSKIDQNTERCRYAGWWKKTRRWKKEQSTEVHVWWCSCMILQSAEVKYYQYNFFNIYAGWWKTNMALDKTGKLEIGKHMFSGVACKNPRGARRGMWAPNI